MKAPEPSEKVNEFHCNLDMPPQTCGLYYIIVAGLQTHLMDKVSVSVRSRIMSRIRGRSNRSTEFRLRAGLMAYGIRGWELHHPSIPGHPKLEFLADRYAIFQRAH